MDPAPTGAETQARATALANEMNSYRSSAPMQTKENTFPAILQPRDPYDTQYQQKQSNTLLNPYDATSQVHTVHRITNADLEYQQRKADVLKHLDFLGWLETVIDMKNPVAVANAKRNGVLDEYYATRIKVIDHMHDVSKYLAKKRLEGIHTFSKDDFKLMYAIETGRLDIGYLGRLMTPHKDPEARSRGLFNPRRPDPDNTTESALSYYDNDIPFTF